MIRLVLAALFVALVAFGVTARASVDCKSFAEARAAYPGRHLWWHGRAPHCWDDSGPARHSRRLPVVPVPAERPDKSPMLLYPTLVQGGEPDPAYLAARSITDWPLILDIDEVTAGGPAADANGNSVSADECCWPQFADPPASFRERWSAMPATWIVAARP
jgi:hypothetical protein